MDHARDANAPMTRIVIIGAGLAGLYAAYRLEQLGIRDYALLEARAAPGGRIASAGRPHADAADRFDLGPTWFWPALQPQLDRLIKDLGLHRFAQHEDGAMLVERTADSAPVRMRGYVSEPAAQRLSGGMQSLVDALCARIDPQRMLTGRRVRTLQQKGDPIDVGCEGPDGHEDMRAADAVWLALPPRLAARDLEFVPALPAALRRQWAATPTWMAPHAKYVALYERPFWREQGLSGEARSLLGPLGEIHDASLPDGSAALFGFFALPAHLRRSAPEALLRSACREQLARLFGPPASVPSADFIKDWALDPLTATDADGQASQVHADAPLATAADGPWQGRLRGIASEWSMQFPGYLAGAVDAAERAVSALAAREPR